MIDDQREAKQESIDETTRGRLTGAVTKFKMAARVIVFWLIFSTSALIFSTINLIGDFGSLF